MKFKVYINAGTLLYWMSEDTRLTVFPPFDYNVAGGRTKDEESWVLVVKIGEGKSVRRYRYDTYSRLIEIVGDLLDPGEDMEFEYIVTPVRGKGDIAWNRVTGRASIKGVKSHVPTNISNRKLVLK